MAASFRRGRVYLPGRLAIALWTTFVGYVGKGGDGARMTPVQIIVGALLGGLVVIAILFTLVRLAISA